MNKYRNSFFQLSFLWVLIFFTTGNHPVFAQEKTKFLTYTQVKGKVTSNGNQLKNIVVSDGKDIVLTNEKGEFEFTTDQ